MSKRSERNSVYIDSHGPNPDALKKGFVWLYQLAKQNEDKQDAVLAVNTKGNLENIKDIVEELIGTAAYRSLQNDNAATVDMLDITLVTNRIRLSGWRAGPVLVIYPTQDLLDTVDGLNGVTDMLVIPWNRDEVESWITTWDASNLIDSNDNEDGSDLISNPLLEEAVETLDRRVNSSTGVTHPLDRSSAIELFKILQENGVDFDPESVRAWLVAEKGWDPDHANDVREIAVGVLEGKRFQYERGRWADDLMDTLKVRATD